MAHNGAALCRAVQRQPRGAVARLDSNQNA